MQEYAQTLAALGKIVGLSQPALSRLRTRGAPLTKTERGYLVRPFLAWCRENHLPRHKWPGFRGAPARPAEQPTPRKSRKDKAEKTPSRARDDPRVFRTAWEDEKEGQDDPPPAPLDALTDEQYQTPLEREKLASQRALAKFRRVQVQLNQIKLKQQKGELMAKEEVKKRDVARIQVVKRALLEMEKSLPHVLANLDPGSIRAILAKKYRGLMERFSRI